MKPNPVGLALPKMGSFFKNKFVTFALSGSLALGLLGAAGIAYAATPSLNVSQSGSSINISVNNADPNATVNFFQRQSSQYWSEINELGQTDSNGNYSNTIPLSLDSSGDAVSFYVLIDGLQSPVVNITPSCISNCSSSGSGSLSLSQTSLTLSSGQSSMVTAYPSSGTVYVSSVSNSSVTSYSLSGNQITVYGIGTGSSTLSICASSSQCTNLYVTVNASSSGFSVSPASLNVAVAQNTTASVINSSGTPYISSNSNTSVASVGLSGQTISVYGITAGSDTVSICQNGGNGGCTSLYITVGSGSSTTGSLTFGTPNPSLTAGQSEYVTVTSPVGGTSFYIASNTNSAVVSASLNNAQLYLGGLSNGTTTLTICQTGYSYCGMLPVTVSGGGYASTGLTLSPSSVNLGQGQAATVIVSGGPGTYFISSNSSSAVASVSLSGSNLNITALQNGTSNVSICPTDNSVSCATLYISVGQSGSNSGVITFSNTSPSLTYGQTQNVSIYSQNGYNGSYSVSGNSNPGVASAVLNGATLTLTGNTSGTTFLTICQTGSSLCGSMTVAVNSSSGGAVGFSSPNTLPAFSVGQYYSYQLQGTGGTGVYTYSITSGSLPSGLGMSSSGLISGTPTVANSSNFSLMLTDSSGNGTAASFNIPSGSSSTTTTTATNSAYPNGELINENGTISIVYRGTKTGFASGAAFTGLEFSFSNVVAVSNSGLTPSGQIVNTAAGPHPWGTWILNGSTVYFVSQSGLIPVPDWNTFTGNGGQAGFIVNANSYDLTLPHQSIMTANDSRLH